MKRPLAHPTAEVVKAIHAEVLAAHGGGSGVREEALLESAVAAPQATMMGEPIITDPIETAAAYLFYLCRNHPFVDGNKRTAFATADIFLYLNGLSVETEPEPIINLVLKVAAGEINEEGATIFFRDHTVPVESL